MSQFYDLNIQGSEVQLRLDLASHNVLAFDGILDVPVVASDALITEAGTYQIVYAPNGGRGEMLLSMGGVYYRHFKLQSEGKTVLDSSWYNTDGQIRRDRLFLNGSARDIYAYAAGAFGKVERDGVDGITPHIDPATRHWMIGDVDTGILARGTDGESAYQAAVNEGYQGTQSEWIASLHGQDGKSAYEIWVERSGNEGKSVSEFLASLKESGFESKAVLSLPTGSEINDKTIYAVPEKSDPELTDPDMWAEYIRQDGDWILMSRHPGSGLADLITVLYDLADSFEDSFSITGEEIERTATISSSVLNKDTGAITSVSVANNVVDTFPVSGGSRYCIDYKTWTLGQTARAWGVIYDSNDNPIEILGVLKTSGEETSSEDTEFTRIITVPVGGTKLRIGYNNHRNVVSKVYSTVKINLKEVVEQVKGLNTGISQMASQVEQLEEDTRTLEDKIVANTTIKDEIITADETIERAAIRGTGTNIGSIATGISVAGYIVDVYYIQPSTTYYIDYETAQVGANVRLWGAVYDSNDVMLESFGTLPVQTDSYTPDDLKRQLYYKTPSNAAAIKLGYHNGGGTTTSSLYTTEVFNIPQKIEELENSAGASDAVSHTIINNPKIDLRKSNLKVLHIGNSFMAGATGYLSQFISAAGIDVSDMCMYLINRSSGSFKSWYNVYHDSDTTTYSISKCFGGITPEGIPSAYTSYSAGDGSGFRDMLTLVKWDLIVIQQASTYSNSHNGWESTDNAGYLVEFLRVIRTLQPQATIGFHLCHASPKQSPGGNTTVAGDTLERHAEIVEATKWISSRYGIDFVIPYGTAIENLRISSLNTTSNEFTYDNHHLADGLAQYVANATYFQTLLAPRYGISVLGNSFRKTVTSSELSKYTVNQDNAIDVTDSNYYEAQMCAIIAVNDMYDVVNPDGADL